jgi:hypothetical protein
MTVMIEQDNRSAAVHHHVVRAVVLRPDQLALLSKIASYWTVWQLALIDTAQVIERCFVPPLSCRWWFEETSRRAPLGPRARPCDVILGQKRSFVS